MAGGRIGEMDQLPRTDFNALTSATGYIAMRLAMHSKQRLLHRWMEKYKQRFLLENEAAVALREFRDLGGSGLPKLKKGFDLSKAKSPEESDRIVAKESAELKAAMALLKFWKSLTVGEN